MTHIPQESNLTLADLKKGEHAYFLSVQGGRGILGRLTSLGFTPGVEIEMIQNYGHGPIVVFVRGTRVALGRQEALKTSIERMRQ
jgi:ferrous iron transport protein A